MQVTSCEANLGYGIIHVSCVLYVLYMCIMITLHSLLGVKQDKSGNCCHTFGLMSSGVTDHATCPFIMFACVIMVIA